MTQSNSEVLRYALVGFRAQLADIDGKISEIQSQLGGLRVRPVSTNGSSERGPKHHMTAAARKRIAAAQKKRWAAFHKEHGTMTPAKTTRPGKRKMSAAGRKAIAEATKKRWAAYRAQKAGPAKTAPLKAIASKTAPKRKMSPARKAALVANLAKARAARAAKRAA